MDKNLMSFILKQVRKRMKTFEIPGNRQSRRVQGMLYRDDETHGFENLCIYVDTALADRAGAVSDIIAKIDKCIYGEDHYELERWLMFFGSDPQRLVAPYKIHSGSVISKHKWNDMITMGIRDNPPSGDAVIPLLSNPGFSQTRSPRQNDLAVFFCRGKNVQTYENQQAQFRSIMRRSIWIFFGDGELPEIKTDGYLPELVKKSE